MYPFNVENCGLILRYYEAYRQHIVFMVKKCSNIYLNHKCYCHSKLMWSSTLTAPLTWSSTWPSHWLLKFTFSKNSYSKFVIRIMDNRIDFKRKLKRHWTMRILFYRTSKKRFYTEIITWSFVFRKENVFFFAVSYVTFLSKYLARSKGVRLKNMFPKISFERRKTHKIRKVYRWMVPKVIIFYTQRTLWTIVIKT